MFTYKIDEKLSLALIEMKYAEDIFELVDHSRHYLREWLPWLDDNTSINDTKEFITASLKGYAEMKSLPTVILYEGKVVGIAGYNEIDWTNRITYIGYWLSDKYQGRGIMTNVCRVLTDYALTDLKLNKVDIRAAEGNLKSRRIPERLGFTQEGKIRQSEWLYDHYVDHIVYGMLAEEWKCD